MAEIWKGAPVAAALSKKAAERAERLKEQGVIPTLAIFRVGEREDDLAYERSAMKRCAQVGVRVKNVVLPGDVDSDTFFRTLADLNEDPSIHGVLLFRPLPAISTASGPGSCWPRRRTWTAAPTAPWPACLPAVPPVSRPVRPGPSWNCFPITARTPAASGRQ